MLSLSITSLDLLSDCSFLPVAIDQMPSPMKLDMENMFKHTLAHARTDNGDIDIDLVPALDMSKYPGLTSPVTSLTPASTYLPLSPSQRLPPIPFPNQTGLVDANGNGSLDSATTLQEARRCKADRLPIAKCVHAIVHVSAEFNLLAQDEKRRQVAKRVHATIHIHTELNVLAQEEKRCKADRDLQVAKRVHTTMHARAEFDLLAQDEKRCKVAKRVHSTMHLHTELNVLAQEEKRCKADRDLQVAKRVHTTMHARAEFNLLAQDEKRCKVATRVHSTLHLHTELNVLAQEEKRCKADRDRDLQVAKGVHTTMHARAEFKLLAQQEKRYQIAKRVHSTMHSHNEIGKNTGSDPTPRSSFMSFFPLFLLVLGLCNFFLFFPLLSLLSIPTLTCRAISTTLQYINLLPKQTKKIVGHAQICQNRRIGIEQIFSLFLYSNFNFSQRIAIMQA
jgi:hypothetical protein